MSHKCREWRKDYCVECGEGITDYVESLQDRIAELEAPVTDGEIVLMIKALEHQSALLPAACYGSAAKLIARLQAKVEELEHELNDARSNRMPT